MKNWLTAICFIGMLCASAHAQSISFSHPLSPTGTVVSGVGIRSLPDTVRILAVMVEFQQDDDKRTTGKGLFGTVYDNLPVGSDIIDPYPHNRQYFEHHLTFLRNYVRKCSGGRTFVDFFVLDSVLQVSKQMQAYSPIKDEPHKPLADLAREAWTLADSKFPEIDFADYDMFVLFHAGVGRDIDISSIMGFNPTPFDLPSIFINEKAFQEFYGTSFKGIPVDDGSFVIQHTAIIPTTENRVVTSFDGSNVLLQYTINGLLAASFGSWAGLPDLYDTGTGRSGIGRFGLMDSQSIFAFGGICPPQPSAWEKIQLGWAASRSTPPGSNDIFVTAHRTDQISTPDIIKIGISPEEYWLLENRQRDPGGNGQTVTMMSGEREVTMTFPKDTTGFANEDINSLRGVIIDVEDIDWSLPGGTVIGDNSQRVRVMGGFLLWHIDERVIEANRESNTVNADPRLRGVDLEQAEGPQDIGEELRTIFGTTVGDGSPLDFWFRGNISPVYKNRFDATSYPSTRSNDGYETHVAVTSFSDPGVVMSCRVQIGDDIIGPVEGWPIRLNTDSLTPRRIVAADLDSDGRKEILVAMQATGENTSRSVQTFVYVLTQAGKGFIAPGNVEAIAADSSRFVDGPVVADLDNDGHAEIALLFSKGDGASEFVSIFHSNQLDSDSHLLLRERIRVPGASSLMSLGTQFVGDYNDGLWSITRDGFKTFMTTWSGSKTLARFGSGTAIAVMNRSTGELAWVDAITGAEYKTTSLGVSGENAALATGDLDRDGVMETAVLADAKLFVFDPDGNALPGFPVILADLSSPLDFILADVDGDGGADIVISSNEEIRAYNFAGAQIDYFPVPNKPPVVPGVQQAFDATSILAMSTTEQSPDALLYLNDSRLRFLNSAGTDRPGFPIPVSYSGGGAALLALEDTRSMGLAVASSAGSVSLYDLKSFGSPGIISWSARFGDARNSRTVLRALRGTAPTYAFFPPDRCYNWPNPVYRDETKIRCYVSEDARISVTIYDLAGMEIYRTEFSAVGGVDNEITWNVQGVESGIYLGHVAAQSANNSGFKIIKIAIVK